MRKDDPALDFSVGAMEMSQNPLPAEVEQALKVKFSAEALLAAMTGMPESLLQGVRDVLRYCAGSTRPNFGVLLRDRREQAGMSRVQLAYKTRLSDATIKFIEKGKTNPSRATLLALLRVPELRLTWDDMPKWMMRPIDIPNEPECMAL